MTRPRLRIGFILAQQFTLCAFANFVDVLRLAADEGDRSRKIHCEWHVLSSTLKPIRSSCGIAISPQQIPSDPNDYDYIVVVGGLIDEIENLDAGDVEFLRKAAQLGIPLCGVCTGAFVLYKLELMHGYKCCVSWFHHNDFLEQFDGLQPVSDQIFIVDRDRLTCSGGASSAHLAAFLVDKHVGPAEARKSLHIMIIDDAMVAERAQPGLPIEFSTKNETVRRALLIMQQSIDTPLPISKLAQRLKVGRRTLERYFQNELGLTPAAAGKKIRMSKARLLLSKSSATISQIATETGFCDAPHFIRSFRQAEKTTPILYRELHSDQAKARELIH